METTTISPPSPSHQLRAHKPEKARVEYPVYWLSPGTKTAIKQDSPISFSYVQVIGYEDGSYRHHRGRTCMPDTGRMETALKEFSLIETTANEYLTMMKQYFAIDKRIREGFIKKHGL